ncbi:MAG: LytTR family DNA-binding domain-containing protein [Bacteroidia bacterium]
MNYIIVDDNKMARAVIRQMIDQFDYFKLIAECGNPIEAINVMKRKSVDLILLDVEMPKMSGLDFLKSIEKRPLVILITAKTDYAVDAFEYNVVDYLVTPVKEERFVKALNRAQELYEGAHKTIEVPNNDFIFIRDKGILTKINMTDILYIQALGDYITIHTKAKKHTIRHSIGTAEEKFPSEKFMRIHRSFIIAVDKVDSIEANTASINKNLIPIGDIYRSELLKKLNLL